MTNPTNVSDEEIAIRSIMMRLYHSRIAGEAFYHQCFVNGEAPGLEANGWIERRGDGWRITNEGVKAWAEMVAPVIASKYRQTDQNELLYFLGRPIRRVALNKDAKGILKLLAENGGEMALADLHKMFGRGIAFEAGTNGLKSLQNGVYVVSDGETVRFTDVGLMVATEMGLGIIKKKEVEMTGKICVVEGCGQPRMVGVNGTEQTRCVAHQREYWNEQARKQREKKDYNILVEASKAIRAEDAAKKSTPIPLSLMARGSKETRRRVGTAGGVYIARCLRCCGGNIRRWTSWCRRWRRCGNCGTGWGYKNPSPYKYILTP